MSAWSSGDLLDFGQSYRKAADYCAAQDRCMSELKLKLRTWHIDRNFNAQIISKLISEGFLDERRFALNYAGGKFRMNGWGKLKIAAALRAKALPAAFIQQALASLDADEYTLCLETLLQKKLNQLGSDDMLNRQKAARFAASRGFEPGLIAALLRDNGLFEL